MVMARMVMAMVLGVVLVSQSGCFLAAAAAGTGAGVAYSKADKDFVADANVEQSMAAATAAMQELKYNVEKNQAGPSEGEIFARTPTDRTVKIRVTYLSLKSSNVNIKVGTWGDDAATQQVWDTIKGKLPQAPQTQP